MSTDNGADRHAGTDREIPVYIVSGGTGASGEQILHTVLVQFPRSRVKIHKVPNVSERQQVDEVLDMTEATGGFIVHTLVDADLRRVLLQKAHDRRLPNVDLMGTLISRLAEKLGQDPLAQPGLYHKLHRAYFERVEAIEFSIAHDDGQNLHDLHKAEIVLLGVSRAGKTPLSMYLSMLGWKVANIPLVMGIPIPQEIGGVDRRRIIGLRIDFDQLLVHRQRRQGSMGMAAATDYTEPAKIFDEVEEARQIFRRNRYATINVTSKPIESSAEEVIELIVGRFKDNAHLR